MRHLFLFFLFLSATVFSEQSAQENKIVILVSTPRSLSTGFLRMMHARGDFEIFHEPSTAPFNATHYRAFYDLAFKEDCFQSFDQITASILNAAEHSNVFVKEMAAPLYEILPQDSPLLEKAHFVFLVRKPQDVALSFYQKGLPASMLRNVLGYPQICSLFELITAHAKHPPHLIFSEDLGLAPEEQIRSFCQHVGIDFKPESLNWKDLGTEFTALEWHEDKKPIAVHYWHGDAIHSTGFSPLKTAKTDAGGLPTFEEVENLVDRKLFHEAYLYNLPHYLALKELWKSS